MTTKNPATGDCCGAACTPRPEPALSIPRGHVGPYFMAGIGRMIWWTGRVAIGLRYEPLTVGAGKGRRDPQP